MHPYSSFPSLIYSLGHDIRNDSDFCRTMYPSLAKIIRGVGKPWEDSISIFHYSRSLEKYALKAKTWKAARPKKVAHESDSQAASSYDIPNFLLRNTGWYLDSAALRYSCQLRSLLQNMTGEAVYFRPGDFWARNVEFGRPMVDPDKRLNFDKPLSRGFVFEDGNPFHYHGY